FTRETFADWPYDLYVDLPRVHLHHRSGAVLDLLTRQAEARSVNQRRSPGVNDPPGGRLAHDLTEFQRAIAFGEILSVGERMLVRDQDGRAFERALAEHRAGRGRRVAAHGHRHIAAPREDVNRVGVDES